MKTNFDDFKKRLKCQEESKFHKDKTFYEKWSNDHYFYVKFQLHFAKLPLNSQSSRKLIENGQDSPKMAQTSLTFASYDISYGIFCESCKKFPLKTLIPKNSKNPLRSLDVFKRLLKNKKAKTSLKRSKE